MRCAWRRQPQQRGVAILQRRRMRMLGREAVVHRQDGAARGAHQLDVAGHVHLR